MHIRRLNIVFNTKCNQVVPIYYGGSLKDGKSSAPTPFIMVSGMKKGDNYPTLDVMYLNRFVADIYLDFSNALNTWKKKLDEAKSDGLWVEHPNLIIAHVGPNGARDLTDCKPEHLKLQPVSDGINTVTLSDWGEWMGRFPNEARPNDLYNLVDINLDITIATHTLYGIAAYLNVPARFVYYFAKHKTIIHKLEPTSAPYVHGVVTSLMVVDSGEAIKIEEKSNSLDIDKGLTRIL